MKDIEKIALSQENEARFYSDLTRNYIENGQLYDLAGADMPGSIVDALTEAIGDHPEDDNELTVFVQDMGENYPGVSISGYRKRVFLGNAAGKKVFTLLEISSLETDEALGLVIEDERNDRFSYWRFDPETESYVRVDGSDEESMRLRHQLTHAMSAPELDTEYSN